MPNRRVAGASTLEPPRVGESAQGGTCPSSARGWSAAQPPRLGARPQHAADIARRGMADKKDEIRSNIEGKDLLGTYGILVAFLLFIYVLYNVVY